MKHQGEIFKRWKNHSGFTLEEIAKILGIKHRATVASMFKVKKFGPKKIALLKDKLKLDLSIDFKKLIQKTNSQIDSSNEIDEVNIDRILSETYSGGEIKDYHVKYNCELDEINHGDYLRCCLINTDEIIDNQIYVVNYNNYKDVSIAKLTNRKDGKIILKLSHSKYIEVENSNFNMAYKILYKISSDLTCSNNVGYRLNKIENLLSQLIADKTQ